MLSGGRDLWFWARSARDGRGRKALFVKGTNRPADGGDYAADPVSRPAASTASFQSVGPEGGRRHQVRKFLE